MSDALAEEAKDLLAGKNTATFEISEKTYSHCSVKMIIMAQRPTSMGMKLRKLKRKMNIAQYSQRFSIVRFNKNHRALFIVHGRDLYYSQANLMKDFYEWIVK